MASNAREVKKTVVVTRTVIDKDGTKSTVTETTESTSEDSNEIFDKLRKEFCEKTNLTSGTDPLVAHGSGLDKGMYTNQSAPKSGCESKDQSLAEFREECLKTHNTYRAKHDAPPLKMAQDLCDLAQKWADKLALEDEFKHSKCELNGESVGENIAMMWNSSRTNFQGHEPVDQWYSEIKDHNYKKESSSNTGHFTQVVWQSSREMGVGRAQGKSGKSIAVANYRPAGNLIGSYQKNVFPPK